MQQPKKEVSQIELFYDLIFAYAISLITHTLHLVKGGTIPPIYLLEFLMMMLVFWTIWTYQTVYANRFFTGSVPQYLLMLLGMFLVIILSRSLTPDFSKTHTAFATTTSILFLLIGGQYAFTGWKSQDKLVRKFCFTFVWMILIAAVFGFVSLLPGIPSYSIRFSIYFLSIFIAAFLPIFFGKTIHCIPTNFHHLSERYSLFVLLLFGEAIISAASSLNVHHITTFNVLYFMIIALLFLNYLLVFQRGIDRSLATPGIALIHLHYFIFVTIALIPAIILLFEEGQLKPVFFVILLIISLAIYFTSLMIMLMVYPRPDVDTGHKRWFFIYFSLGLFCLFAFLLQSQSIILLGGLVLYLIAIDLYLWQFILKPR